MKKFLAYCVLLCLIGNVTFASAGTRFSATAESSALVPENLSNEQMDNLLAPIALYPDPLLAQVFPASTFVDQIEEAARWLRSNNGKTDRVDNQKWDVSVRSTAHYPQVVYMMSDKLDWTAALGQAYVNQSTAVLSSVQRLRMRAKEAGYLESTPQQTVIVEKEVIKVVPSQPQVIYVPTYNPQVVYVNTGPSTGQVVAATAIAFGAGLAIGAWLNNDCNWYSHTVYYHGWHGTGWIHASYTHVHINSVYVNRSYTNINVNRTVVNRNVNYNNISHYNNVNRNVNYNNINRNNVNANNINRNNVNNNNMNRNINTNNQNINQYRGQRDNTGNRAAARPAQQPTQRQSLFGGYGNAAATRQQSQRGQASRATPSSSGRFGGGGTGGASRSREGGGGHRRN